MLQRLRALDGVAQNIVVVRCEIGTASTVARQIDNLNHNDVVGTLAGDDTFLVIVRDDAHGPRDAERISIVSERPSAQAPSSAHASLSLRRRTRRRRVVAAAGDRPEAGDAGRDLTVPRTKGTTQ